MQSQLRERKERDGAGHEKAGKQQECLTVSLLPGAEGFNLFFSVKPLLRIPFMLNIYSLLIRDKISNSVDTI